MTQISEKIEKLMSIPAVRAVFDGELKKHDAAVTLERAALVAELRQLEDDFNKSLAAKNAATEKAKQLVDATEATHKKATDEFRSIYLDRRNFINGFERQKDNFEKQLLASADSRIDDGIRFFRNTLSRSLSDDHVQVDKTFREKKLSGTVFYDVRSNKEAVLAKHAYLRAAIATLEEMKLQAAFDDAAVQLLIDGIPSINVFSEVQ